MAEGEGTPSTATGNLNRVCVGQRLDRLELTPLYRDSLRRTCKVINQLDLWSLHLVRHDSRDGALAEVHPFPADPRLGIRPHEDTNL